MAQGRIVQLSRIAGEERERVFDAFRRWGYLEGNLDPLGFLKPQPHPELLLTGEAADQARKVYCGTIGADFMHLQDPARRRWIAQRLEADAPAVNRGRILERLIRADLFEQVLQTRYIGSKPYFLESLTPPIPRLHQGLSAAAPKGAAAS